MHTVYLLSLTVKYIRFKIFKNSWITTTKYECNAEIFNYTINNVSDFVPTTVEVIVIICKHFTFVKKVKKIKSFCDFIRV